MQQEEYDKIKQFADDAGVKISDKSILDSVEKQLENVGLKMLFMLFLNKAYRK